jgi:hypothetical protein
MAKREAQDIDPIVPSTIVRMATPESEKKTISLRIWNELL